MASVVPSRSPRWVARRLVKLGEDKRTIEDIRLAFGVAGPTPMRAIAAEDAVRGLGVAEAAERIGELACACTNPRDSWRASKDFRLQLIKEMFEAFPRRGRSKGRG